MVIKPLCCNLDVHLLRCEIWVCKDAHLLLHSSIWISKDVDLLHLCNSNLQGFSSSSSLPNLDLQGSCSSSLVAHFYADPERLRIRMLCRGCSSSSSLNLICKDVHLLWCAIWICKDHVHLLCCTIWICKNMFVFIVVQFGSAKMFHLLLLLTFDIDPERERDL